MQRILIKADDFTAERDGTLAPAWERFLDLVQRRQIKASLGLIGNSLERGSAGYLERARAVAADPSFEFFHHGYDHRLGARRLRFLWRYHEFWRTSYRHQTRHLRRTLDLARDRLGVDLVAFGAPGNAYDATTLRALDSIPEIRVWLFGDSRSGKIVLERSGEMEFPTHRPDFDRFAESHDESRPYVVYQVHPRSWDEVALDSFERMIGHMAALEAGFVLPGEFATSHGHDGDLPPLRRRGGVE